MIKRIVFDEYSNITEIEFINGVTSEIAVNAFLEMRQAIRQGLKPKLVITPAEDGTKARNTHWYSEATSNG